MNHKKEEKLKRLKYTRALEKFFTRVMSLVKNKTTTKELLFEKIDEYWDILKYVEAVRVDSNYFKKLQEFINLALNLSKEQSIDELKAKLTKESNLVHKAKTQTIYKRKITNGFE